MCRRAPKRPGWEGAAEEVRERTFFAFPITHSKEAVQITCALPTGTLVFNYRKSPTLARLPAMFRPRVMLPEEAE